MKKLAVIGRPNVGKSTLFNRLVGKRTAIVHDTPGVTRDRKTHEASIGDAKFLLIDTAGLEISKTDEMQKLMVKQTEAALEEADLIIFMGDGTHGLTDDDKFFADKARKTGKPLICVVNKCERKDADVSEFHRLGFGEPIAVSAEHGLGLEDLYSAITDYIEVEPEEEFIDPENEEDHKIRIALVGRPNVGKSTIINKILDEERVITSPIAGTTRDAIEIEWEYADKPICLIDTAGLRKRSNVHQKLEKYSVGESLDAMRFAQIALLVLDATQAMEKQDLKIAENIIREGRALLVVVNKWDLVKEKNEFRDELDYLLGKHLNEVSGVKKVFVSAVNDTSLNKITDAAIEVYDVWNRRVSTGKLNRWLEGILEYNPPPIAKGRRIKIRYMTQAKTRPPTFIISASMPKEVPGSYLKFLKNKLREEFGLEGTPLRIRFQRKENPYDDKNN